MKRILEVWNKRKLPLCNVMRECIYCASRTFSMLHLLVQESGGKKKWGVWHMRLALRLCTYSVCMCVVNMYQCVCVRVCVFVREMERDRRANSISLRSLTLVYLCRFSWYFVFIIFFISEIQIVSNELFKVSSDFLNTNSFKLYLNISQQWLLRFGAFPTCSFLHYRISPFDLKKMLSGKAVCSKFVTKSVAIFWILMLWLVKNSKKNVCFVL
jgi:hypothetical protein